MSCFKGVFSVDVSAIGERVIWLVGVFMVPGLSIDLPIPGEEWLILQVLERVVLEWRLKGIVDVLHSLNANQFGILDSEMDTELYLIQGDSLSILTE